MSLRARVLLGAVILQAALLLVLAWSGSRVFTELMARQVHADAQRTVSLLGTALAAPLMQRDIASLHSILSDLHQRGAIAYLGVTDRSERVVAEIGAQEPEHREAAWFLPFRGPDTSVDHAGPIGFEAQELGRIRLKVSGDSIREAESRLRWNLVAYGLVIALLFAVLITVLGTVLLRRIRRVAEASREISEGRFDTRIPGEGGDDFGVLVRNFNHMAGEVKRRIAALESSEQVQRLALSAGGFRGEVFEVVLGAADTADRRRDHLVEAIVRECPDSIREGVLAALPGSLSPECSGRYVLTVQAGKAFNPCWTEFCALVQPVRPGSTDRLRVALAMRDVSERIHMEDALRQSQKAEALGMLAGGLAHDLGNALTVSSSGLDLLGKRVSGDPALSGVLDMIRGATDRCLAITRSLMDFARGSSNHAVRCDLNDELFRGRPLILAALGSRVRFGAELCKEPMPVSIDTGALTNVMINLAVNARDALEGVEDKQVVLRTRIVSMQLGAGAGAAQCALIEFSDSGCGLPPEVASRAFEPFFTTKPPGKGTGLGLSTVQAFAKNSGGRARISAAPGGGAVVSVVLPLVPA